jgi:hypothetical protein
MYVCNGHKLSISLSRSIHDLHICPCMYACMYIYTSFLANSDTASGPCLRNHSRKHRYDFFTTAWGSVISMPLFWPWLKICVTITCACSICTYLCMYITCWCTCAHVQDAWAHTQRLHHLFLGSLKLRLVCFVLLLQRLSQHSLLLLEAAVLCIVRYLYLWRHCATHVLM